MTISPAKLALVLALGATVVWVVRRDAAPDPAAEPGIESTTSSAAERAQRSRLELAVTSAVNAADCGSTEIGYSQRSPQEAARRLVALMNSASVPPGSPAPTLDAADYVLGDPSRAWQVSVRVDSAGGGLAIEGYGPDLRRPLFTERVPCS